MAKQQAELEVVVRTRDEASASVKQIESGIIRFVGAVSSLLSVFGAIAFPIKEAAEFQKELLNVQKTTDFTDTQIRQLSRSLTQLATTIDLPATELARIAAIAGQLGLGSSGVAGIAAFTETASRFASVIDVTADEAANGLAKMVNIFKVPVTEVERLSSLLNELSNNSTATGDELLDIVQRIGTAGGTLTAQQSAALAALGRDLGLTVETVGTSFQKIFLDLQTKASDLAPLIGLPVEEFTETLNRPGGGIEALKLYLQGLLRLPPAARAAFAEQTTGGGRVFGLVQNLLNDAANGFELLDARLGNAKEGFEDGTSAIREQQRVLSGFLAQVKLAANGFRNLAIEVGQKALPVLTQMAKAFQELFADKVFIEKIKQVAETIGRIGLAVVNGIVFLTQFGDEFGVLVRLFQVFLGIKIVGFFGSMAKSLYDSARAAGLAVVAFKKLATGQQALVAAQGKGGAASAVQLSPFAAGVGGFLGKLPSQNRQNQAASSAAATAAAAQQTRMQQVVVQGMQQRRNLQLQINAATSAEQTIAARIAAVKAGAALQQGESLRKLNAQLQYQRGLIDANRISYRQMNAEILLAVRNQRALTTAATQGAAAAAAQAAGGLPFLLGKSFGNALNSVGPFLLTLGKRIIGFILPVALWTSTILGIVSLFVDFDTIIDFLARLIGYSGTARQRAALDARVRAKEAEEERDKIEGLADEYQKLKTVIESYNADSFNNAVGSGQLPEFLAKSSRELGLIQARLKQNTAQTDAVTTSQANLDVEIENTFENLQKHEKSLERQQTALVNLLALQQKFPRDLSIGTQINVQRGRVEEAQRRTNDLQKQYNDLNITSLGLIRREVDLRMEIPALLDQEKERVRDLAVTYDADAAQLAERVLLIAETSQQLAGYEKQLKELRDTGADVKSAEFVIAEDAVLRTSAVVRGLTDDFNKARQAASILGTSFITAVAPDAAKANVEDLRRIMTLSGLINEFRGPEATRKAGLAAAEAQAAEIGSLAVRLASLRKVESAQKTLAAAAQAQADSYAEAYKKAADAAADAVRGAADRVAKFQQAIKTRGQSILLANFDASEQRAQRLVERFQEASATALEKDLKGKGFSEKEREAALKIFRDIQDAQEEVRRQDVEIVRVQKQYTLALEQSKKAQADLAVEEGKQSALATQITDAKSKDPEVARRLTAELDASRAKSEVLLQNLLDTQATLQELATQTVGGSVFTDAAQPIDASAAEAEFRRLDDAITGAKTRAAETARVLQTSTAATATSLQNTVTETTNSIKEVEQRVGTLTQQFPELVGQFNKIGEAIIAQLPAFQTLLQNAEAISNLNFEQSLALPDVATFNQNLDASAESLRTFSAQFKTSISEALNGDYSNNRLQQTIRETFSLKFDPVEVTKGIFDNIYSQEIPANNVTFPSAKAELQEQLNEGAPLTADVNLRPGGVPGNAAGGYIRGPGTGTSDSILSRLSNGEYVNDAKTVRRFGPGFFAGLKSISNRGGSAIASFLSGFGGIPLPGFAGGGLAGSASRVRASGGGGTMDVVRFELNLGGQTVPMFGEREQAKRLVNALRNIERGT